MPKAQVDLERRSVDRLREIRALWAGKLNGMEDERGATDIAAARRSAIFRLDQYIDALEQRLALRGEFPAESQGRVEAAALRWFGKSSAMRRSQVPDVQERR